MLAACDEGERHILLGSAVAVAVKEAWARLGGGKAVAADMLRLLREVRSAPCYAPVRQEVLSRMEAA